MNVENIFHGTTVGQRLLSDGKNNSNNTEREAMISVYLLQLKRTKCGHFLVRYLF